MSNYIDVAKIGGTIISIFLGIFILTMLIAFPTKWLWNWLMPEIFGLTTISAWKAWGLLVLSGLLFKSTTSSSS